MLPPKCVYSRIVIFYFCLLASSFSGEAKAGDHQLTQPPTLEKGMLLVASKRIASPIFGRSVILLTEYNRNGAMGLIVNKTAPAHEPGMLGSLDAFSPIFHFGGPVAPHSLLALISPNNDRELDNKIIDNVYLYVGFNTISAVTENLTNDAAIHLFAGFAGWAAGQLEHEIERGDWLIVPPVGTAFLSAPPKNLWNRLYEAWTGKWI